MKRSFSQNERLSSLENRPRQQKQGFISLEKPPPAERRRRSTLRNRRRNLKFAVSLSAYMSEQVLLPWLKSYFCCVKEEFNQ
ncbi:MAG: hypothetical protein LBM06_08615, partial [Prevotellaceae bacterium]|nr:hypothetical protein [Prevotellaceae bacterium]